MNSAVALVLVFVFASALRDVYFGEIFQRLDFFAVVLTAFFLTTVIFLVLVIIVKRSQFQAMKAAWREVAVTNIGTAMAWLSYFFALKLLEPAVVNMLHIGIGPVLLVALNRAGLHISAKADVTKSELMIQAAILLSLMALAGIVLAELSGLGGRTMGENAAGLALALASGIFISLATDVTKRLHNKGVSAEGVLAVRFIAIVLVAAIVVIFGGGDKPPLPFDTLWPVAAASLLLMVLPLYALQLGVARTSTISVWIVISLSPVCIFAAQYLDDRLTQSPFTLACIIVYSVLALGSNMLRKFETQPA